MKACHQVLILGGDAGGNLGDRAILESMCKDLRRVDPAVVIYVVASIPDQTGLFNDVKVIAKGPRGLLALCRAAMRSDMVLCGGGGLFQDDDSLVKMPYWAIRVLLMRIFCKRIIGYSLGVGPLRAGMSKVFARLAFSCMEQVTVRDNFAQATAQPLTHKRVTVVPDPALLTNPEGIKLVGLYMEKNGIPLDGRPLIGVAPRRWFPPRFRVIPHQIKSKIWPGPPQATTEESQMIKQIAKVLDSLVHQHNAYIVFLPTYNVRHEGDVEICENILSKMKSSSRKILQLDQPAMYKGVTGMLHVLIGGRMHPTIFAMAMGTPCVGLAYNMKFYGFFELLGLSSQVMDVEAFVLERRADDLIQLINYAMNNKLDLSDRVTSLTQKINSFNNNLLSKR